MKISVSVVIPVYNAEKFLEEAVESALQFSEVEEVILVEDGSPDNSLLVCKKLEEKYPIVKVFQHENGINKGAGATRNLGLEKASKEFIAFLDADDVFTDLRFTAENEYFQNPKIDGVFGGIGVRYLSEKGKKEYQEKFKNSELTTVKYETEGKEVFYGLLDEERHFGVFFSLIGLTVRKSAIERENLRFNEKLRIHQDTDFIRKLSFHCHLKTGIIEKPVALRGVHEDNRITKVKQYSSKFYQNMNLLYTSSNDWAKKQNSMDKKIQKHIRLRHLSFKIANTSGIGKYISFLFNSIANPDLLKTRYRFHALKKHVE